ncbi:molecular chaperone GrpE [Butyrivibrio hungatei]|uniref:Protein GrpE n=1 Tax=Butyrivibrio hungatei TaxID=185008 RepID=A0A1G5CHJ7_9FIRM|nr:nucleotide exchange factor GrpE [Butyrivibrio hungatei]SCY01816.1 molecular chaperone GrpE [Butyrivibrio hungatei]
MSSTDKKKVHDKPAKEVNEQEKEVLEEIMEELEEEAKENKEAAEKAEAEAEISEEEASAEENEETSEEESGDKKKGLFNKKEKKDPLKEKIDELNDRLIRQVAEFDNFRKRTDKEKAQMFEQGQGSILEKLLPVIDNFERGLQAVPEAEKDGAFADGMNKIYKQLMKQMEDLGVTPIEAVGKEFDPNFHNAVMQVESEEYESGIVAQELQKGYMFHDTVLRHSMVGVTQ